MAVCNLFSKLENNTGNFLMFSQYTEDLTRNNSNGDDWKVVPSKFIALNIDYSKFNKNQVIPAENTEIEVEPINEEMTTEDFNELIPNFFQNYYENGCAYGRNIEDMAWTSNHAKNLFWNCLFDNNLLTAVPADSENSSLYVNEIVYGGQINMHSYNIHQGMGYGELYCYIPSDTTGSRHSYQVTVTEDERKSETNTSESLEGFPTIEIGDFSKQYFYNDDYSIQLETIKNFQNISNYNINTIIVLYSVKQKSNDTWKTIYSDIPMGIYFTGKFNNDKSLTNQVLKLVSSTVDSGTSYGLRICTRFSATANSGKIITDTNTVSDTNYNNICQLMTAMNENLSKMLDVTKSTITDMQYIKDWISTIKNNRTNVPYVKTINGKDYWFVNGRLISSNISTSNITT
jgi:hypothetical protein